MDPFARSSDPALLEPADQNVRGAHTRHWHALMDAGFLPFADRQEASIGRDLYKLTCARETCDGLFWIYDGRSPDGQGFCYFAHRDDLAVMRRLEKIRRGGALNVEAIIKYAESLHWLDGVKHEEREALEAVLRLGGGIAHLLSFLKDL